MSYEEIALRRSPPSRKRPAAGRRSAPLPTR